MNSNLDRQGRPEWSWRGSLRNLALSLLLPLLASCLQVETTVQVRTDGSGTVTERFLLSGEVAEMFAQMAPEGETFDLLDEAQLGEDAAKYGPGVSFLSAESLETDFGKGYIAVYSFSDVNSLRIDQDPGSKVPEPPGATAEPATEPPVHITFSMTGSNPSELTVHWPVEEGGSAETAAADDSGAAPEGEAAEAAEAEVEMMKQFFKDMRMAMIVEVEGAITETNATHQDGSRVTLLDFNFGEILGDEESMKLMMSTEPQSIADMKAFAEALPGIKMEFEKEVKIAFE